MEDSLPCFRDVWVKESIECLPWRCNKFWKCSILGISPWVKGNDWTSGSTMEVSSTVDDESVTLVSLWGSGLMWERSVWSGDNVVQMFHATKRSVQTSTNHGVRPHLQLMWHDWNYEKVCAQSVGRFAKVTIWKGSSRLVKRICVWPPFRVLNSCYFAFSGNRK